MRKLSLSGCGLAVALGLLLAGPARAIAAGKPVAPDRPKLLIGAWECVRGACPDEQIQFSVEEGKPLYASWIHQHPGTTGTWSLDGRKLTIRTEGSDQDYEVVSVTRTRLVLREQPGGETAKLRRLPAH